MGNKNLIPRNGDPYDSGIDSDEGKNSIMNALFIKDLEEAKINSKNVFNKNNSENEKSQQKVKEDDLRKSIKYSKGGYIKLNYGEDISKCSELNRPLLVSCKTQEHLRMSSLTPDITETKCSYDSDNGSDSPPLYEVELTASDEDDSSVLELVIPMQTKIKRHNWFIEFFCFGCLYSFE